MPVVTPFPVEQRLVLCCFLLFAGMISHVALRPCPLLLSPSSVLFEGSATASFVAPRLPSHLLSFLLEKSFLLHLLTFPLPTV